MPLAVRQQVVNRPHVRAEGLWEAAGKVHALNPSPPRFRGSRVKPIQLWDHQKEAVARALERIASGNNNFAYFFEMGTGKTLAAITTIRHIFAKAGTLKRTLIFGPPIVLENWRKEILQFSNIQRKNIGIVYGHKTKRLKVLEEFADRPALLITNYESLYMVDVYERLMAWHAEIIIFDESHKLKNFASKRTKLSIALADTARFKYLLTGTPVLNDAMDIFPQFRAMDGGKAFGKNFFEFRNRFFFDENAAMPKHKYFPSWVARKDREPELNRRISEVSMAIKKKDCLTLPPLIRQEYFIELGPEQRRVYTEMEKTYLAEFGGGVCAATLAITRALRLQQISSGYVPVKVDAGDGVLTEKILPLKDNPRALALQEILEGIVPTAKVLVWAVFADNYRTIAEVCDELKVKYVSVTGQQTGKQKMEAVAAINEDDATRVLIGHPGAGGIGINLVAASYSIFYSRGFSLEFDLQAEARNYRGGSERHATINRIDLIAKNTIDEKVSKALSEKQAISDRLIVASIKELVEERKYG
jgi:SNF2 family DNA or RNA helicase